MAIVCSARSGSTKALGTTNLLLRAASEALSPRAPSSSATPGVHTPLSSFWGSNAGTSSPPYSPRSTPSSLRSSGSGLAFANQFTQSTPFASTVDLIRMEHLTAARSLIQDQGLLKELEREIERDCDSLRTFLFAAQVIDEISPRSKDSIMGMGERLACKLIAAVLRDRVSFLPYACLFDIVILTLWNSGYR